MIMAGVALGLFSVPAQADIKIGLTGALTGPLAGTYAPEGSLPLVAGSGL